MSSDAPGTTLTDGSGTGTPGAAAAPSRPWWKRPNFVGVFMAVTTFGWALTPSLLPRPWIFEGVIAGLGAALGYGLGCLISWLIRLTPLREPSPTFKTWAWRILAVWAIALVVANLLLGTYWQNGVREAVGFEDEGYGWAVVVGLVALPTAIGAVYVGKGLRRLNRWIGTKLDRWLPAPVAFILAALLIALLVYLAVTDVLFRGFSALADKLYAGSLTSTADGVTQPQQPEVSGSPQSLIPWDSLGFEGRNFVSRGPTAEELSAFNGSPAKTPVRVYAGLNSAGTAEERAALAVQDLERAGGFERKALFVCGTTGTGWIEPQTANALEYEWNGDSAIVGIQYSYLPSWISTLVDVDDARTAGQAIWTAVYDKVQSLPETSRPQLFACGLSLGSFSLQSAFPDAATIAAQSDGAVFVGSPNFSQPWGAISAAREPGSPQWQPVYQDGATVRFAGVAADMAEPAGAWGDPKVLYVQHANDSVVWWSPALLAQEPDWLKEPPGPGRSPEMRWYPVITFLQVTVDQFMGVAVPQGQGHNYGDSMAEFWATVSQPPGWTDADSARLTELIPTLDNY
ncbi:MAG: alpha/beta hydrolase [Candidatus Nanopelagicales bacterium]